MTYSEATEYLFNSAPLFQNIGAGAYKEGLSNTHALDQYHQHPHTRYRTIHVAGTNGKGSVSHSLASILQCAGYKVGLYTSPHLVDFRERIRVNGEMIPEQRVIRFVEEERAFFEPLHPSFFELTTALAFQYFSEMEVDVAVIEVGLGGRLDCTNIIRPELSIITNISLDHIQFLGDTHEKIAHEKAGIIKPHTPVVIGETGQRREVREVFAQKALAMEAPITFADEEKEILSTRYTPEGHRVYDTLHWTLLEGELGGECQDKNMATILQAVARLMEQGFCITNSDVRRGVRHVCTRTGLMGRWQRMSTRPLVVCDTGHNVGGMEYIVRQLSSLSYRTLHMVFGMVNDKDISHVLDLLPKDATYYFTQASVKRALPATEMQERAQARGLIGNSYPTVDEAYRAARQHATEEDVIFVGGSSFVVADFLKSEG